MAFKVPVGESDFAALWESRAYYVDKTEILYNLFHDTNNKVTLFTRPRRFGKTLMASMMENFLNIRKDSRSVFHGLAISRHEDFCKEWMNQYPVLFVSFKDVEGESFEGAYRMLQVKLADLCKNWTTVFRGATVDEDDWQAFLKLKAQNADDGDIKNALKTMMRMMYAVYGRKVILFIDEYDVPLARAGEKNTPENRYYDQMLDVIRSIMSTALKDNEFLERAVVTGCLRIAKESIFTGTNNFASYSVMDNRFSTDFGFTEEEVKKMLETAGRAGAAGELRKWYDGYVFGNSYVYCPWDVVNHVSALVYRRDARPKNYWKNTSHNGILLSFVERTDFDISDKFEVLLNGGTIRQRIADELTYDTLHETEDNLWSVLVMTGYLTKAEKEEAGDAVDLKIPNAEIANIFEDTVVASFKDTLDPSEQKELMDALWNGDEAAATKLMTRILFGTISYHDYHENYYHAFLTGLISGLGYAVKSNLESGLGRSDIDIRDKRNRRGMVIETKKSVSEDLMERDAADALAQIEAKRYLDGFEGFESVAAYGISFYKKTALIKRLRQYE